MTRRSAPFSVPAIVLFALLPCLLGSPASAAPDPVLADALDLMAEDKPKKAGRLLKKHGKKTDDEMAWLLHDLFVIYDLRQQNVEQEVDADLGTARDHAFLHRRSLRNQEIRQRLDSLHERLPRLGAEDFAPALETVEARLRQGAGDGGPMLSDLRCHLRMLHPGAAPTTQTFRRARDLEGELSRLTQRFRLDQNTFRSGYRSLEGGEMTMRLRLDADGCVADAEITAGREHVAEQATITEARWATYEPVTLDGEAVAVELEMTESWGAPEAVSPEALREAGEPVVARPRP